MKKLPANWSSGESHPERAAIYRMFAELEGDHGVEANRRRRELWAKLENIGAAERRAAAKREVEELSAPRLRWRPSRETPTGRICGCGCGRLLERRRRNVIYFDDACQKRAERARKRGDRV